jgi:hypothetical protein
MSRDKGTTHKKDVAPIYTKRPSAEYESMTAYELASSTQLLTYGKVSMRSSPRGAALTTRSFVKLSPFNIGATSQVRVFPTLRILPG